MRNKVIYDISGGVVDTTGKDADLFSRQYLRNRATLESMLFISSGKSFADFDKTVQADIVTRYEAAQVTMP